jgi:alkylation response protein AidB-like acyl-CoA dehydrogenase
LCAEAVGSLQHLLDTTVAYTRTRVQFERPIAANQVLRHRMVDMAIQCEEARAMSLRAALAVEREPHERAREVSGAKLKITRAARMVSESAVQLHGAMGVTDELDVGAYMAARARRAGLDAPAALHLRRGVPAGRCATHHRQRHPDAGARGLVRR